MSKNSRQQIQISYIGVENVPVGFSSTSRWYDSQLAVYDLEGTLTALLERLIIIERIAYEEAVSYDEIPTRVNPDHPCEAFDELSHPKHFKTPILQSIRFFRY